MTLVNLERIQQEILPKGYITVIEDNFVWFHYVAVVENCQNSVKTAPNLMASVLVTSLLEFKAYVKNAALPFDTFKHVLTSQLLSTTSELTNILALCKSLCADSYDNISHQYLLNLAILLLKEFSVENIAQNADEDATS